MTLSQKSGRNRQRPREDFPRMMTGPELGVQVVLLPRRSLKYFVEIPVQEREMVLLTNHLKWMETGSVLVVVWVVRPRKNLLHQSRLAKSHLALDSSRYL